MTPRIPPKNGASFAPGSVIRLEFPAQGYVNPNNTTLSFDVTINYGNIATADKECQLRFQNNIQSCFSRVRLLYGATPIEDIIGYNQIVRAVTEWTGASSENTISQTSINEGIGGYVAGRSGYLSTSVADTTTLATRQCGLPGLVNVRQAYIHGISTMSAANDTATNPATVSTGNGFGVVPYGTLGNTPIVAGATNNDQITSTDPKRRYQVQFALGLFNQPKLIPTKFMASQLAIEITLANPSECLYQAGQPSNASPTYTVTNVNLIPEILEFDSSYDEMFLKGLMNGGVPIKFSTWNNYKASISNTSSVNIQIQERSRSVKSIFAMQRRDQPLFTVDTGATFFSTGTTGTFTAVGGSALAGANTLQEYQYRIGGRYFPASPVQNAIEVGGSVSNGGAESWVELSKALNTLSDARLSTPCNVLRWAVPPMSSQFNAAATTFATLPEFDYRFMTVRWQNGAPVVLRIEDGNVNGGAGPNAFCGNLGSSCFAMAIDLETSNGGEIAGLNAEEQSDITLIARWNSPQGASVGTIMDIYTYIDSMIVLRENNVLELIQ